MERRFEFLFEECAKQVCSKWQHWAQRIINLEIPVIVQSSNLKLG